MPRDSLAQGWVQAPGKKAYPLSAWETKKLQADLSLMATLQESHLGW